LAGTGAGLRMARLNQLGMVLLAVVAIVVRCYGLSHTLGYDEAWVANSLHAPTLREMFFYDAWAQTTPPAFLLLARAMLIAGSSNLAMHLLAFAMGLTGVAVVTWIGWRELSPSRGLWMGLLAALSGPQVAFAKEAKQYSGEFLVAALLLAFFLRLPKRLEVWGPPAALSAAFAFGPGMLAFLPAALISRRPRWQTAAVWILATGAMAALLGWAFYWPNRSPALFSFWGTCFPHPEDPSSYLRVASLNLKTIFVSNFREGLAAPWNWVLLLLAVPGILQSQRRGAALLALTPIALALTANFAGQYPLCEARLSSFLFPCVLLLHGLGLDFRLPGWVGPMVLAGAMAAGLFSATRPELWPVRQSGSVEPAVAYLSTHMDQKADVLFVHGNAQEEYKLYARLSRFAPADVIIGQTGVGCCPRNLDAYRAYNDDEFFRKEFEQVLVRGTARRIWFLHLRQGEFGEVRQEEPEHRAMLATKGCRREQGREIRKALLSAYRCPL